MASLKFGSFGQKEMTFGRTVGYHTRVQQQSFLMRTMPQASPLVKTLIDLIQSRRSVFGQQWAVEIQP